MKEDTGSSLRSILARGSTRWLLVAIVLTLLVRGALPSVVRWVAVDQIDKLLVGYVDIESIDLALLRGGVTLHGVALHTEERAPVDENIVEDATLQPAAKQTEAALFTVKRLFANIGLLALFRRVIDLEAIELDDFAVRLERAPDGSLVLPQPVPTDEPPYQDEITEEPEAPWGVLLQNVRLTNGRVAFDDHAVGGDQPQRVEVAIPEIHAERLAFLLDAREVEPGNLALQARFEGGVIELQSTLENLPAGPTLLSRLRVENLPIKDVRAYIGNLGWTALTGSLDLSLQHRFETGGAHDTAGVAVLRDLTARIPDLDQPALAWKRLEVDLKTADLVARDIRIAKVSTDGLQLVTRPFGPQPVPVIARLLTPDAGDETSRTTGVAVSETTSGEQSTEDAPWTWRVDTAELHDATIAVQGGNSPLSMHVDASLNDLAGIPDTRATLDLKLSAADLGSLGAKGDLAIDPVGFAGTLSMDALSLARLAEVLPYPEAQLLRKGVANAAVNVSVGNARGAPEAGVRFAGNFVVSEMEFAGTDPKIFAVRIEELALELRELVAPGTLATEETTAADTTPAPIDVAVESLRLVRPEIIVTRDENGLVLPWPAEQKDTGAAEPPRDEKVADAGVIADSANEDESISAGPAVRVSADSVSVTRGRLRVKDKAVRPEFKTTLDPVDLAASDVRWPGPAARDVNLSATGADGALLTVTGAVSPGESTLVAKLKGLSLAAFNGYAATSGYAVGGGTASLKSKLRVGADSYDTTNKLVLSRLDVTGEEGESLFMSQFGMPLSLALYLMTNLEGDIVLDLPIAGDRTGTKVGIGTLVRNALSRAILNAVTSPLKLIGAVARIGEKPGSLTPQPLIFAPGRADLAQGEETKLDNLASLLTASPAVALRLRGQASAADRRWLEEQSLRVELEESGGLTGALRTLGERGERSAVLKVLQARARGETAELPEEYEKWFEQKVSEHAVPDTKLAALAEERALLVQERVASVEDISPERIIVEPTMPEDLGDAASVVEIRLGARQPAPAPAETQADSHAGAGTAQDVGVPTAPR